VSAAVLVPLIERQGELFLLFTLRPETLRAHPGQVSFPGGRIDPEDKDVVDTALREAHEELGLLQKEIELIGQLDDSVTGTGFIVAPVIGVLKHEPVLVPNPAEVQEVFWLSLDALMSEKSWRALDITRDGQAYRVWFFDNAPHTLWGATAAMTRQLLALLR
jgi:8-oxo-dGTP pyrophosphatase MutT (NUDIX family)